MAHPVPDPGDWRQEVDLDEVEVALHLVAPLFDAVHRAGSHMMIRIDADRRIGVNPARFTVVIYGNLAEDRAIRYDDADLVRAVRTAIAEFDRLHRTG
jgi:hypothetical protein